MSGSESIFELGNDHTDTVSKMNDSAIKNVELSEIHLGQYSQQLNSNKNEGDAKHQQLESRDEIDVKTSNTQPLQESKIYTENQSLSGSTLYSYENELFADITEKRNNLDKVVRLKSTNASNVSIKSTMIEAS